MKNYGKILYSSTLQFDRARVMFPLPLCCHPRLIRPSARVRHDFGLGVNVSRITRHLTTGLLRRRVRDSTDVSRRTHYYNIIVPPA